METGCVIVPELPEVETIRNVLDPQIAERRILSVDVHKSQVIAHPSAEEFCTVAAGQKIVGIKRRGKFLQIILLDGSRIVLHLRMTGCLLLFPEGAPLEKHTHVVFHLDNMKELRFHDTRRFGRFWFIHAQERDTFTGMEKLGPEPFETDFSAEYLKMRCSASKKAIKECILDQKVVAGIGNIYSDEILFSAKLHPARAANTLSDAEWERLAGTIPERLKYYVEKNTISFEEYMLGKGKDYRNTPYLQVYGRGGKPCLACGTILCKTIIGGRTSVFCPVCQKQ